MVKQLLFSFSLAIISYVLIGFAVCYFTPLTKDSTCVLEEIVKNYHSNIRGYMFSGFLSVGTFMFSLMTFVITNLKEKLFDTKEYLERIAQDEFERTGKNIDGSDIKADRKYLQLRNQCTFISLSIASSLLTSVSQFTLGFSNNIILVIVCTFLGILTLCFLSQALFFMWRSLRIWLSIDIKK